jgi:Ribonuclease G/E
VKEAIDMKGPKLTANIEFTGKYVVYMPFDEMKMVHHRMKGKHVFLNRCLQKLHSFQQLFLRHVQGNNFENVICELRWFGKARCN